jgi:uncharacterized protein (TIGR00296 family)
LFLKSAEQTTNEAIFQQEDGRLLVSSAREAISNYLRKRKVIVSSLIESDPRFETKLGCFVTLKQNDKGHSLRGCIGFPEPVYKLSRALTEAAIEAATGDPRFPAIDRNELNGLLVEVSILTSPKVIVVNSQKELPSKIQIGKDGLIMRWSFGSGLLLPQVATEEKWDGEEFLTNLSMKAGAMPDQWLIPGTQVLKFQAQIFSEETPNGEVVMTS